MKRLFILFFFLTFTASMHAQSGCAASISYDAVPELCPGEDFSLPVSLSGNSGGSFVSAQGLDLDALTGTIRPFASLPGSYTVVYTPPNCPDSSTNAEVEIPDVVQLPEARFEYNLVSSYTVRFRNTSSGAEHYIWTFLAGDTSHQVEPVYTFPFYGTFPVSLIAVNGCGSDTLTKNVVFILNSGMESLHSGLKLLSLQPNPGDVELIVQGSSEKPSEGMLFLYSMEGRLLRSRRVFISRDFTLSLDTGDMSKGVYLLQLYTENGSSVLRWQKQ